MHLLATTMADGHGDAAVDLGQTPGDIVVLSAADSELAALSAARQRLGPDAPSLRLASLLRLGHPLSVDLHVERVVARARLVVVRLLGGRSYWPYGLERVAEACRDGAVPLAILPGDERPDPELASWSTLPPTQADRLWRYLVEGGPANAEGFLRCAAAILGKGVEPADALPVPRAGLYRRNGAPGDLAAVPMDRPRALVLFYRALLQAGDLEPVEALLAGLDDAGLEPVGLFVTSLKDGVAARLAAQAVAMLQPAVAINLTSFAVGEDADPLAAGDMPVLQAVLAASDEAGWRQRRSGLGPRDLAMHVALPEIDGRILARAISFKGAGPRDPLTEIEPVRHRVVPDRVTFVAALAAAWARLRATPSSERRVAVVLANYPIRDGRLANGVGLDTPASCVRMLQRLRHEGYDLGGIPADGDALVRSLAEGVTNARAGKVVRATLDLTAYLAFWEAIPVGAREAILRRWGPPDADPHLSAGCFPLAVLPLGNVVVALQPSRGWDVDAATSWHSPDLPPPHAYLALYAWLRTVFRADALVQLGKHGNLEWLPGKALALDHDCHPEVALGPLPLVYPFIVNDPGEGTQAKRRSSAVIVDHLTPPLTRAESYGALRDLEALVDEYWQAAGLDARRLPLLEAEILDRSRGLGLDRDLDLDRLGEPVAALNRLDAHLCDLKELQIRDGLHVLGLSPEGSLRDALLAALARAPRGDGGGRGASLSRALAADLGLELDPLTADAAARWDGPRPGILAGLSSDPWRSAGDTVERLALLGEALVSRTAAPEPAWNATRAVLDEVSERLAPALDISGIRELDAVVAALAGRRVRPGPSGAPTRGRPEVLPTGRNFYAVDTRAVPTPTAWRLGWQSAALLVDRYVQLHGDWPRRVALSAWGTSNMRTGGDDVAQALALLGCRPTWEPSTGRVTGVEVLPASVLERPRVDVTLRISGLFRDAFPGQVELLDDAVRAVAALDEPESLNPLAAAARAEAARLQSVGLGEAEARRRSTFRIFGAAPGAYGTGLQGLVDNGAWSRTGELTAAFVAHGGHAYGRGVEGTAAQDSFGRRLAGVELVLHNQDNREHDLLDSDDYWQFEGGLALAVRETGGRQPEILHTDTSLPERPRVARLQEEIGRIVRGRAANPKWLKGAMRHGYKGAFEIAATVDYLFAFAATSGVVGDHHFDALYDAYLDDPVVRRFMAEHNPAALQETAARFAEAIRRQLWRPRKNSVGETLAALAATAPRG